ncbi:hypothetical protein ACWU37_20940 (plasmid) [Photobacterium damselae subsp. damselae]
MYKKNPNLTQEQERYLSQRLIRCGDLLGEGDLDPSFKKEVRREYRAVLNELYPDIKKSENKKRSDLRDKAVKAWLEGPGLNTACSGCSSVGCFKQSRRGSYRIICTRCNMKSRLG